MESNQTRPYLEQPGTPRPPEGGGIKKALGPLAVIGVLLLKFKTAIFATLKFLPAILKTGGTMFLSIWVYAMMWGWWFGLGFVLMIFVHECGHLVAAKFFGLKVGAPVFIPFMGASIALKEAPRNAWVEAIVGIGGPILGTIGGVVSYGLYYMTGNELFKALAFTGFMLNLFNLIPISPLDGGRIVTALSPWLWLVGVVLAGALLFVHFNIIVLFILIISLPRLFGLFRKRSEEEKRYFEVTAAQRVIVGVSYFGLIAFLLLAMMASVVHVESRGDM